MKHIFRSSHAAQAVRGHRTKSSRGDPAMSRRTPSIRRPPRGLASCTRRPLRPGRIERPARKPKEIAMQRIKQSIEIKAPVAAVFEQVNEPAKLHEIWPSLMEVANVQRRPNGSYAFDWVYKMVGMKLYGRSEPTEFAPDRAHRVEVYRRGREEHLPAGRSPARTARPRRSISRSNTRFRLRCSAGSPRRSSPS